MNLPLYPAEPISPDLHAAIMAHGLHQVNLSRWLAVGSLVGLIVLSVAWELVLAPIKPGGSLLALKAIPLCVPLAGLLKNRMYTYRWVSLLVWLYFTEGIVRATGLPSGAAAGLDVALAWTQVLLCTVLFIACASHVRWRLKHPSPQTEVSP